MAIDPTTGIDPNASTSLGFAQSGSSPSWAAGNPFLGQNNPYLNSQINSTMSDMARNYNLLAAPQSATSMANSGSFGNSGLDQMNQNQLLNQQQAMGQTANNMRSQDYNNQQQMYQWDQGFNANNYQNAFNNNLNTANASMGLLGQANTANQNDITNSTNVQNTPMNYYQQFSNSANAAGGMGQTATVQMPSNSLVGALGGWSLGAGLLNSYNKAKTPTTTQ